MTHPMHHKGFSLIELLVVIMIVSMVYFLGFSGLEKPSSKKQALTPLTLKLALQKSHGSHTAITFMCLKGGEECFISKGDNLQFHPYKSPLNLHNIHAYAMQPNETLERVEYGRFHDKKVSFVFHIYPNNSSTQIVIEQNKHFYFLPSFFREPQEVDDLDQAEALWLQGSDVLDNSGDFY